MSHFSNINDFQIRRIQRLLRKNNILKNTSNLLKLNLTEKSKTLDFNKFTSIIMDKEVNNVVNKFILSLKNYKNININSKIFLTSFLIKCYPDQLLGKNIDHPVDINILDWSKHLIEKINDLNQSKEIDKFCLLLNNYNTIFNQWKMLDKSRSIEAIIISYYNRCKHIEKIESENKLTAEEKVAVINELNMQKEEVLKNIKYIDPTFNINYFKENYESVYKNINISYQKMNIEIANTMKKAYYDMLVDDINNENLLPIAEVMVEISKRILTLIPEKKREKFAEKLNIEIIVNLISDKEWTNELKEYIKFITETVFMLGAAQDDNENKLWLNQVNEKMQDEYNKNLPLIIIQIQEKLDRIFELIQNLKK